MSLFNLVTESASGGGNRAEKTDMIKWHLDDCDDERRWYGCVDNVLHYLVYQSSYASCNPDLTGFVGACNSDLEGIIICEAHHKYGDAWPTAIKRDPILKDRDESLRRDVYGRN